METETFERNGFTYRGTKADGYRVSCDQCEALVINGCACHETGCYNARRAMVAAQQEESSDE